MSGGRWRVAFTTVMGRTWKDYRSEDRARAAYRGLRHGMWGERTVLLHEEAGEFVQVAP